MPMPMIPPQHHHSEQSIIGHQMGGGQSQLANVANQQQQQQAYNMQGVVNQQQQHAPAPPPVDLSQQLGPMFLVGNNQARAAPSGDTDWRFVSEQQQPYQQPASSDNQMDTSPAGDIDLRSHGNKFQRKFPNATGNGSRDPRLRNRYNTNNNK